MALAVPAEVQFIQNRIKKSSQGIWLDQGHGAGLNIRR
jgi:hypothetical protein